MRLSDLCIDRPVFAVVLNIILILFGIVGLHYLEVRTFPVFVAKKIYIETQYQGASAPLVERNVTTPLESALSGVSGVDYMTSTSVQGDSQIKLTLNDNANVDEVANQVRSAVYSSLSQLPEDIETPDIQVGKGDMELMDVMFMDKSQTPEEIRDYLNRFVVDQIRQVPGVSEVDIVGANEYAMRIWLNPQKMASLGVSVNDVQNALKDSNLELPVGDFKAGSIEYPVTADTNLNSVAAFQKLTIKNDQGRIVKLSDIAKVTLGSDDEQQQYASYNGQQGVALSITSSDDASEIEVANALTARLAEVQKQLPKTMTMARVGDFSIFLKQSIQEVYLAIIFSILCVIAAIFLFLGNFKSSLIPIATIPVCFIGAFGLMYAFGFSINGITLMALVLAIGLVVDDAIVMLENIHRYRELGQGGVMAAKTGSRQIAFSVIGMTICLAAVYAPVGLMQGMTAVIFREFAFTLAGAVIISGFVALTLTPMMCAYVAGGHSKNTYERFLDRFLQNTKVRYQKVLTFVLAKKRIFSVIAVLLACGGFLLFKEMPSEFMPHEDLGFLITVFRTPTGASLSYVKKEADQVYQVLHQKPYVDAISNWLFDGYHSWSHNFIKLKPYNQRDKTAMVYADEVSKIIDAIPGVNAFVFSPVPFGGNHNDLQLEIMSSGNYLNLYHLIQNIKKQLATYPGVLDVDTDMLFNSQQYSIVIDRHMADALHVKVSDIDQALSVLLGGANTTYFNKDGYRYHVRLQARKNDIKAPGDLSKYYVSNADGKLIPLSNFVTINPVVTQATLPHYNQLRSGEITAQLAPGYSIGKVVSDLNQRLPAMLPKTAGFAYEGSALRYLKSKSSVTMIFGLGVLFIYLVLAALFESFIDPFIILLVVPLGIFAGMSCLKWLGGSVNIYTEIGMVTLVGLIAKHGILITQFANEKLAEGLSASKAVLEAATIRLRPILMTTTAMIFGALPLICATGAGSVSRFQIGVVIIAGLFFGTLFSLFVVPIAYLFMKKLSRKN